MPIGVSGIMIPVGPQSPRIDRSCIEAGLDVRRIEILDHLDACPAVLGNLVDVRAFNEPQADVSVSKSGRHSEVSGADGGTRTLTLEAEKRVLSPLCLPIPPRPQGKLRIGQKTYREGSRQRFPASCRAAETGGLGRRTLIAAASRLVLMCEA